MKKLSIRIFTLAAATVVLLGLAGSSRVSADTIYFLAGPVFPTGPKAPPPPQEDHPWASPYHTAVWIPGHNELSDGSYVWVSGYYGYPPHRHSHWVAPRYPHTQEGYSYRPGHWSN